MSIGKLTGPKKAAVLLLAVGEESASEIIKNLEDSEIQQVAYYMARFSDVSTEELDAVLEDYYRTRSGGGDNFTISASGDFVRNTLSRALGADRAKTLVENLSADVEESALESLKWLDAKSIANFITHEHPQTIAIILSHLENAEQTASVVRELPENIQADVVYRMATLESIQPGVVNEIDEVLSREMQASRSVGMSKVGGTDAVAEMLNSLDKTTENRILATMEESDPDLAEQIRELMFTFEDLVLIDTRGMQAIVKEISQHDLALALRTASDSVKEIIFNSMSKRAGEMLREDLEIMGPVKVSDVEKAQQNMVKIARRMEEQGDIVISGRGGSDVI